MRNTLKILALGFLLCWISSCQKKLNEEVKSSLTPEYFKTLKGFTSGLNAVYAGNRDLYGPETGIFAFTVVGTDEFRLANGTRVTAVANYSSDFNAANEFSRQIWNTCYSNINTCNGLVDYGTELTGIDDQQKEKMLAEAKFLRANYYFLLVRFFGPVSLNKHFAEVPSTAGVRDSLSSIYNFILADLKYAVEKLPASPQSGNVQPGRATSAAARQLMALVYLTKARSKAASGADMQMAYNTAVDLISDAPELGIGLLDQYAEVHKPGNENNKEVLFSVQYSADQVYGGAGNNLMNHFYVGRYELNIPGIPTRDIINGRPYNWIRGTDWLYNTAFADKQHDSRYDGTFQSVWLADEDATVTRNGHTFQIKTGDTALWMPGYDVTDAFINSKPYVVIPPRKYTQLYYPTMTKYLDPNRTINVNQNSTRPLIVYRFAGSYLIAAEAAYLLGDKANATKYINIIRSRAARAGDEAFLKVMPSMMTLDFILDERTREFCGEQSRWLDLVRTGKLLERVKKYDNYQAHLNIAPKDVLRPIPQSQIDAVITGPEYGQNEGW